MNKHVSEDSYKTQLVRFLKLHAIKYQSEVSQGKIRADFIIHKERFGLSEAIAIEVKSPRNMDDFEKGIGQATHYLRYWPNSWYAISNGWAEILTDIHGRLTLPIGIFNLDKMKLITSSSPEHCPFCNSDMCLRCNLVNNGNRLIVLNRFQGR